MDGMWVTLSVAVCILYRTENILLIVAYKCICSFVCKTKLLKSLDVIQLSDSAGYERFYSLGKEIWAFHWGSVLVERLRTSALIHEPCLVVRSARTHLWTFKWNVAWYAKKTLREVTDLQIQLDFICIVHQFHYSCSDFSLYKFMKSVNISMH